MSRPKLPPDFVKLCQTVTAKRPRTVINHILKHGFITTQAAKVRGLCAFLREGFVVEFARGHGVEAEVELIFPAKLVRLRPQPRPATFRSGESLLARRRKARIKAR